jgi:hypothetical protein
MFLSVTLPAKKFQLFQPIGGVCATSTCGAADFWFTLWGAFSVAAVWAETVNVVKARTATESEAKMRMARILLENFSEWNTILLLRFRQWP